ncbi:hypothetical protein ACHQM5_015471 [Ranunculus cassubicifolius]
MCSLQLSTCKISSTNRSLFLCDISSNKLPSSLSLPPSPASSFWGKDLCIIRNGEKKPCKIITKVVAMSDPPYFKMNLSEYMVTLEKPLGIRFAVSLDGKIFIHALKKGGNAEKTRIINFKQWVLIVLQK